MRFARVGLFLSAAALALAGCGGGGGTTGAAVSSAASAVQSAASSAASAGASAASSAASAASSAAVSATSTAPAGGGQALKVGLAYDIGGRGDQSFNDAAAAGLDRAKAQLGVEVREASAAPGESDAAKEERLRQLAEGGYNPIIAVGFAYSEPLKEVAAEFEGETQFAIIDDAAATGDNIANLTFAENEGSFLVGVAAALKSEKDNVGFVGGVQNPLIKKFEAGFTAGVKAAEPSTRVQVRYLTQPPDFTGFTDPAKGRTAAEGMFDAGADVVYHAAGASGGGVFEAAQAANGQAIGVDSDQALTADADVRDVILTSMLKKIDVAVFDFIQSAQAGQFQPGPKVYDLEAGGVDYSTTGGKVDDIRARLEEFKQQIISGAVTVPES